MTIGKRIKDLRTSLGMTQDELAKLTGYKDVYQHLYADKEKEIAESLKNKFSDIYATKYDTNNKK